jgi:hypothetical protein
MPQELRSYDILCFYAMDTTGEGSHAVFLQNALLAVGFLQGVNSVYRLQRAIGHTQTRAFYLTAEFAERAELGLFQV